MEQTALKPEGADGLLIFADPSYRAALVVTADLDRSQNARVAIRSLATSDLIAFQPIPSSAPSPGSWSSTRIENLQDLPLSEGVEFALQYRTLDGWVDSRRPSSPLVSPGILIETITPAEWGVAKDCWVTIQDSKSRKFALNRKVSGGATVKWARDPAALTRYTLKFHDVSPSEGSPGPAIGSAHRWVPRELRGEVPAPYLSNSNDLQHSVRHRVVLAPGVRGRHGKGLHVTTGYIGAWVDKRPIPEALLSVLGRQYSDFLPYTSPTATVSEPVIYLGAPQSGWGHFLTQGLARIWYALDNPEVPVVWDAGSLSGFQREVLNLLGYRNREYFLRTATRFAEVIFPQPGICIGDYVHPVFTEHVGLQVGAPVVPGKKILLSRSKLGTGAAPGSPAEDPLDRLARDFGFEIVHPEAYSVREQLDILSSSAIVLGIEGSAMHTPLLLADGTQTQFFALTRHRAGSGVFEHLRQAKGLKYATLNFKKESGLSGFRGELDLDFETMRIVFELTDGLEANYVELDPYLENPSSHETPYSLLVQNFQTVMPPHEEALRKLHLSLLGGSTKSILADVASLL